MRNDPVFKVLQDEVEQAGTAGRRRTYLANLPCLRGQPRERRDRILDDLEIIGHPIYCETVKNEVVYYYDGKEVSMSNVPDDSRLLKSTYKKKGASSAKRENKSRDSQAPSKRKAAKLCKELSTRNSKTRDIDDDSDDVLSTFSTDDDEGESSEDSDDDDDASSDSDDMAVSSEKSNKRKAKGFSKDGKGKAKALSATKKKVKKLHWDAREDAGLLYVFLKTIANDEMIAGPKPVFSPALRPSAYTHMTPRLLTEKNTKAAGLTRSVSVYQNRLVDLLETFETAGGIVSFIVFSGFPVTKDVRNVLHKFVVFSSLDYDIEDGQEAPFTAGLCHQFCDFDAKPSKEIEASRQQLVQHGWLGREDNNGVGLGPAFESCFQSRITPTYKRMLGNRSEYGTPKLDVCGSILHSYKSSIRPDKAEVSSAEGLLAVHNVFQGSRSCGFEEQCFIKTSVKLSKKEEDLFEFEAPNASSSFKESKVIGAYQETAGKTGHYDKPINRINTTMAFGIERNIDAEDERGGASASVRIEEKTGRKGVESCPWLEENGTAKNPLFDFLVSKVIATLASYPGASLEHLHSSLAILSIPQVQSVLALMEKEGLIRSEVPAQTVEMDGMFSERTSSGNTNYYIY